jgi:hypothetical protein
MDRVKVMVRVLAAASMEMNLLQVQFRVIEKDLGSVLILALFFLICLVQELTQLYVFSLILF